MSVVSAIGTYLPPWGTDRARVPGVDEDAITLAVEAGTAALAGQAVVTQVVLVTRDVPLLEGGSGAVLLAGLGLDPDIEVSERLGGAPAALDAITSARPHALIIAVDLAPAGAVAVVIGGAGVEVHPAKRLARSLPVRTRDSRGSVHNYGDPRLLRESGVQASIRAAEMDVPVVVAGLDHKQAKTLSRGTGPELPTAGASAALFGLAHMVESGMEGTLLAVEQATITGVVVDTGAAVPIVRNEPEPRPVPKVTVASGGEIPISLAAYARAFDAKLRWRASRNPETGELDFPPRLSVDDRGRLLGEGAELVDLPRTGTVYTSVTVHVPVPGLPSPYSLVIVELDGVGVRALVKTTGGLPGAVGIGDRGRLVLRRVAVRSGVPDYGYAFLGNQVNEIEEEVA